RISSQPMDRARLSASGGPHLSPGQTRLLQFGRSLGRRAADSLGNGRRTLIGSRKGAFWTSCLSLEWSLWKKPGISTLGFSYRKCEAREGRKNSPSRKLAAASPQNGIRDSLLPSRTRIHLAARPSLKARGYSQQALTASTLFWRRLWRWRGRRRGF